MDKSKKKKEPSVLCVVNNALQVLLENSKYGSALDNLNSKEHEDLWSQILRTIIENLENKEMLLETIQILEAAVQSDGPKAASSLCFLKIITLLNNKMSQLDPAVSNILSKFNLTWLAREELPEVNEMAASSISYLLCSINSKETPTAEELKRLFSLRSHFTPQIMDSLKTEINEFVQKHKVIAWKGNGRKNKATEISVGCKIIGHLAAVSGFVFDNIFKTIDLELKDCPKNVASAYGNAFLVAWLNAPHALRPLIKSRFQDIIEEFIKMRRTSLDLSNHAKNILEVIDVWNREVRKKGSNDFTSMLTECYQPILWKYLRSGLNFQRVNAADLFFKAFPLHVPGDPAAEISLINKQIGYMEEALRDDCDVVRRIAVNEVLNILPVYWLEFSTAHIHKLMTIITKEDVRDHASSLVRRAVWRGFLGFLKEEASRIYLSQILPALGSYINDVNQAVRIAFIELLIAIRELDDPDFKFTDVVPISKLMQLLMHEDKPVGRCLVKLLLPKFYTPDMEHCVRLRRFIVMFKKYRFSYRKFFLFSKGLISFENAVNIMVDLITHLGKYVIDFLRKHDESIENETHSARRSARRQKESSESSDSGGKNAYEDPAIVIGIFDVISILWLVHDEQLRKPENRAYLRRFYDSYVEYAGPLITFYKDTEIFDSVVSLSGNVEMAILTKNGITLPGYCIKQLKLMDSEAVQPNRTYLSALIKWGCGFEILEQITLWLEAAFSSVKDQTPQKIGKKVKITETIEPNSLLSVHILDWLLGSEHTKQKLMKKNYNQLLGVWEVMSSLKKAIFGRLMAATPFTDPLLSDDFLMACFKSYVMLIPHLYRPPDECEDEKEVFNAQAEAMSVLEWTQNDLVPLLLSDKEDCPDLTFICRLVADVLFMCDNMLSLFLLDHSTYAKIGEISISLLTCQHCLYFVKPVIRVATAINFKTKIETGAKGKDIHHVWSICMTSLVFNALNALIAHPHPQEEIDKFHEDFDEVSTLIGKIFKTYEFYTKASNQSAESVQPVLLICEKILSAVRSLLYREIPHPHMTLPIFSDLSELPYIANLVLGTVYNNAFWTPFFLTILKMQISRTVKTLCIDILILNIFGKICYENYLPVFKDTLDAAVQRLNEFKRRRGTRGHRRSCTTLETRTKTGNDNDEDEGRITQGKSVPLEGTTGNSFYRKSQPTMPTISEQMETDQLVSSQEPASSQPISDVAACGSQPVCGQPTFSSPSNDDSENNTGDVTLTSVDTAEGDFIDKYIKFGEEIIKRMVEKISKTK